MAVKLSYSKISTYIECGRKYFLSYVANLGTGESVYMTNGSTLHKCFEDFVDWPEEEQTLENLEKYYINLLPSIDKNNLIHETIDDIVIVNPTFEQKAIKSLKSFYEDYKENFYKQERKEISPNIILQEQWFNLPLGEPDENGEYHQLRGLIDRIDEEENYGEHIIDYKTGQSRVTYKALQDPLDIKSLQLSIYSLVRFKETGKIPFKSSFFYVEPSKGAKKQVGQYRSAPERTEEQLMKLENYLTDIANEIDDATKKLDFHVGDSPNCYFCPFNKKCDIISEQQLVEIERNKFVGEENNFTEDNGFW